MRCVGLAAMGWRSWSLFELDVNQQLIEQQISGLTRHKHSINGVPTSLLDLGYVSIGLDDGWQVRHSINGKSNDEFASTGARWRRARGTP